MMKQIHVNKSAIPGVFTFFNLLFGFLAILQSALGAFGKAAWLILAAALFDGLDGATARLLKVPSNFGKQFDSAADLVSFCTAPAVLLYFAYIEGMHPFLGAMIVLSRFLPVPSDWLASPFRARIHRSISLQDWPAQLKH